MKNEERFANLMEEIQKAHARTTGLAMVVSLLIARSPNPQGLRNELPELLEVATRSGLFHPIPDRHLEETKSMIATLLAPRSSGQSS